MPATAIYIVISLSRLSVFRFSVGSAALFCGITGYWVIQTMKININLLIILHDLILHDNNII